MGTPMPEIGHSEPSEDTRLAVMEAENARLRAALDRVLDLCDAADPSGHGIPGNATLLVRTAVGGVQDMPETERVFVRSDGPETPAEPALNTPLFYPVGGRTDENNDPWSYGEVLWLDDPSCDRGSVDVETYLPLGAIRNAINEAVTA